MSALSERLQEAAPQEKPDLTEWLDSLSPDDRALIENAGRSWKINRLEKFIRNEGVRVSDVSLARWVDSLG